MTSGAISQPTPEPDHPAPEGVRLRSSGRRPLATDGERRALASVLRLRILRMCLYESLTNKEIALRLQKDPATVLHHVRTLVDHEFLRAEEQRPGRRGSREVPYRATGKSWQLDFGDPASVGRPMSNTLLRTFFEEVAEVPEGSVLTTRLGLRLSDEHFRELTDRVGALLEEFAARAHDPDGQAWSVFLAMHPDPAVDGRPAADL